MLSIEFRQLRRDFGQAPFLCGAPGEGLGAEQRANPFLEQFNLPRVEFLGTNEIRTQSESESPGRDFEEREQVFHG